MSFFADASSLTSSGRFSADRADLPVHRGVLQPSAAAFVLGILLKLVRRDCLEASPRPATVETGGDLISSWCVRLSPITIGLLSVSATPRLRFLQNEHLTTCIKEKGPDLTSVYLFACGWSRARRICRLRLASAKGFCRMAAFSISAAPTTSGESE